MIKIGANVDFSNLERLRASFGRDVQAVVDKAALSCATSAQEGAPVDSGALKASIHAQTSKTDGSALAISTATSLNPKSEAGTDETPLEPYTSRTIAGTAYSGLQEFGANGLPGRYYMTQAAVETAPKMFAGLKRVSEGGNP